MAASAPPSEREERLYICWNGDDLPTKAQRGDPLLWSIFTLKSGWSYLVTTAPHGREHVDEKYFTDEKEALREYKKRVKAFSRSKEIDYGLPIVDGE